jgi:hypothetical protein
MWTKDAPTKAGWYWWQRETTSVPICVHVVKNKHTLSTANALVAWRYGSQSPTTSLGGKWWSEPIKEPLDN